MTARDLELRITTGILIGFALGAALYLATHVHIAWGKPPPGGPTADAEWFAKQENMVGGSCCGLGDGHRLLDNQWRLVSSGAADNYGHTFTHYEVEINGHWYEISPGNMRDLKGGPNPTGGAVVWYSTPAGEFAPNIAIYCFAPGWQT